MKFIICEDNEKIRKSIKEVINKTMMKNKEEYKILEFKDYNNNLIEEISKKDCYKVYILDIELPNGSGIDISREIRSSDWDSQIIFLTSHAELKSEAFYTRYLVLSFISKYNNYKIELEKSINTAISIKNYKNSLSFISNYISYRIVLGDIIYILKDKITRKTIIKTCEKEYETNLSIKEIEEKLDSRFFKTHQSAIINVDNVKNIDYNNEIITFKNKIQLDYLSKNKKRELKEYVEYYN